MAFEDLGVSKELAGLLRQKNIATPTKIQEMVIPAIFAGKDILAQSETGSGKTLGFALPLIEKIGKGNGIQALIIAPTRELVQQIAKEFILFSRHKWLEISCVYGGVSIGPQVQRAPKADIVIGTPGRILDLVSRGLSFSRAKFVVLDECDRMLDMGFIYDVEKILAQTPRQKQTMLFSATIAETIARISRKYLNDPLRVALTPVNKGVLAQYYYSVQPQEKFSLLVHLLRKEQQHAIVFCNTRRTCHAVADNLDRQKVMAKELHGGMTQAQRDLTINAFKQGTIPVLIATDVAARGLHVDHVTYIYNYELPPDFETFIHRVGRTARAGENGIAVSFVNSNDRDMFSRVLQHYEGNISRAEAGNYPRLFFLYDKKTGFRPRFGQAKNSGFQRGFPKRNQRWRRR